MGQDGLINAGITLLATINVNTIPDGYSEIYFIRPISIAALDLKLRDDLLSLMERRGFYKGKMQPSRRDSGCIYSKGSSRRERTLTLHTHQIQP